MATARFEIIQAHHLWYQSKACMLFPISE